MRIVVCPSCGSDNTSPRASVSRNHTYECHDCCTTFGPDDHVGIGVGCRSDGDAVGCRSDATGSQEFATLDLINHPLHYTAHPSGIECIQVVEHLSFNVGNAIKYLWRAGLKSPDAIADLRKAAWYVNREIERLKVP